MPGLEIAPATAADAGLVLQFIHELAEYEQMPDSVVATEETLRQNLFGEHPAAECAIAYLEGEPAALALWFQNYSTWTGKPGLWLEDLFVRPAYRRCGVGRALLVYLAALCVQRGYSRFEWSALDWNQPAIDFYRSLGAESLDEWTVYRLSGVSLRALASRPL